jgi:hypothetical protein
MRLEAAIYQLNPTIVSLSEGVAFDAQGNQVSYNKEEAEALVVSKEYQRQRAVAYPSIQDQLDTLYHGGYDAWKATITAVKEEFPKP